MASKCIEYGSTTRKECVEERDEGYNACREYRNRCCDWWPCSWACAVVSAFCFAYEWVSNIVCVAYATITEVFCVLWEAVITVVSAVLEVLASTIGLVLDLIGFVVKLFTLIPGIGRLIDLVLKAIGVAISFIAGLADRLLGLIGIRPEKKLRIVGLILKDESGNQVISTSDAVDLLDAAAEILKREANIRLLRSAPFQFSTPFGERERPDEDWVKVVDVNQDATTLDLPCNDDGFTQNLGLAGVKLDALIATNTFFGTARRLLGLGGPLVCFFIRHIPDDKTTDPCGAWGCCQVVTDYITIRSQPCGTSAARNWRVIAHEIGHTGLLTHRSVSDVGDADNLMAVPYASPPSRDTKVMAHLSPAQAVAVRTSRFVTYL